MPDNNNSDDPVEFSQEQGVLMDCILCNFIYPDLSTQKCPVCKGKGQVFQQAQMMDRETSQRFILSELVNSITHFQEKNIPIGYLDNTIIKADEARRLKDDLIRMIRLLEIYSFNLKEAFRDLIYEIDKALNFDPLK